MRILAIRGENLASLKAPFEIDLTAEPLASAGLFAITGETGAGKSTILDALCLALYGDCPRLAQGGVNDEVPDASGESIRSRDARAILRRGAAGGFAEVDFVGRDGVAYRARWGARRARGRAEGRLQNVDRALIRLSDGQVLESQLSAVNARVAEATGLAFDEFRRTVLLAQGDFDAFLTAGTVERAALLEKVTGAQRYRDISRRVFERHAEARAALRALEDQRAGAMALTEDARAELMAQRAGLLAELGALNADVARLTADIDAHVRITAARRLAEEAAAAETQAREAAQAAAPDRARLLLLDTALGLRAEHDRAERAGRAVGEGETALAEAERRLGALVASEQQAVAAFAAAAAGLEDAERVFKAFGPHWSAATDLDGQIRTAAQESADAEDAARRLAEAVETGRKTCDDLATERRAALSARDAAEADLAAKPGARRVAEQGDALDAPLDERATLVARIADRLAAAALARAAAEAAALRLEGLDAADAADRHAIAALAAQAAEARARLREIARDDPGARMARLLAADAALREMIRAAGERLDADGARALAVAGATAAAQSEQAAQAAAGAAALDAARATAALDALAAPLDLADAAASEQAAHLRGRLVAGAPCPVCGATEHPVAADAALAAVAGALRARVEAARAAQTEATERGVTARTDGAQARLAGAAAQQAQALADRRIAAAAAGFDRARAAAVAAGLSALAADAACGPAALTATHARLQDRRVEIAELADAQSALREAVETDDAQAAALRAAIEAREPERARAQADRADGARRGDLEAQGARQDGERVAAIDRALAPLLAGIGQPPDAEPEAARTALRAAAAWFHDRETTRAAAAETLAALDPRIGAATAALGAAEMQAQAARAATQARRGRFDALRADRAALLGGEDVETHRSRCNRARLDAQLARDAASAELSTVRGARAGAEAQAQGLRDALLAGRAELAEAGAALDARLAAAGLVRDGVAALIAEAGAEAAPLRERLKTLDDALTSAVAAAQARRADLRPLLDAGAPQTPEPDLRAARDAAEAARSEAEQRAGALTGKLEVDDSVRASLVALDGRIAAAKGVHDTWAAVNEAVGSAQGDKFARIAQGVTLSLLVERANRHLADLKPRYRLTRGGADLALHVVDRDMGEEVRSTRSLSGGERFLVSLALALALSGMGARGGLAATLFIDEGFGALDAESLDVAIDALETLQAQGRAVGVISHVEAMKERIPVQVRVVRRGAGVSTVEVDGAD